MTKAVKRKPAAASSPAPKRQRGSKKPSSAVPAEEEWSYDRLWDDHEVTGGWHSRNVRFWKSQGSDVRGMTGGGVSQRDMAFSRQALGDLSNAISKTSGAPCKRAFGRGLDCGAGSGRVTHGVLKHFCGHVDLVEFVKKHLLKAKASLPRSANSGCSFEFHNSSMQKFGIKAGSYNLVWCQWLLMYLTDADALDLLKRAAAGLATKGGFLVVKENVSTLDKATYFDNEHGDLWVGGESAGPVSCVRTCSHYEDLFERSGLHIHGERHQTDLGPGCMEMHLWVLGRSPVVQLLIS